MKKEREVNKMQTQWMESFNGKFIAERKLNVTQTYRIVKWCLHHVAYTEKQINSILNCSEYADIYR